MDNPDEGYNLRRRKRSKNPKKSVRFSIRKDKRRKTTNIQGITRDGYVNDGYVVDDGDDGYDIDEGGIDGYEQCDSEYNDNNDNNDNNVYFDLDSKPVQDDIISRLVENGTDPDVAEKTVRTAFKGTGDNLIQDYIGCKPSDEGWKLGLSQSVIGKIEPQLQQIRSMIKDETPTIPKILQANITLDDKKRCILLFDQLNNTEPYTKEHVQKAEEINNIIRKGKRHTKEEIKQLEQIEAQLKTIAAPPDNLKNQILILDAPDHIKGIIYGQYLEMMEHEAGSQAYNSIREEIEWSVRLPHNRSHDFLNLGDLTKKKLNNYYIDFLDKMDQELYGMKNIKMRMLHIINDRITSGNACGRNIAITGPPGTGKTAIGKALAKVLDVPFEKISVGGMEDASILKGSDRVWNSASPSIVLQILARMKSSSGIVMFDEVDKLGETPKGKEVQYALLHISDYVHNKEFRDNYLNKYPHDFSKILFIYNMNTPDTLDPAFRNRLDIVETQPYTTQEKMEIARHYVLPRSLIKIGLEPDLVTLNTKAANKLVMGTREDLGARSIEKAMNSMVGKINMYNSILLPDGTTGSIDLGYVIPNFKFPLVITPKLLIELTGDSVKY